MAAGASGTSVYRTGSLAVAGAEPRPLHLGYHALLDGQAVVRRLARELPPPAADLIEIAAMAYAADRLTRRPADQAVLNEVGWGRRLRLQIPVRAPRLWNSVADRLEDLLKWLTDDDWSLEFCQLAQGAGSLDSAQGFLFHTIPGGCPPALFSGGLDSALGLARDLQAGEPIVVSVYTNRRMQAAQQRVACQLAGQARCVHLQCGLSLHEPDAENSQRTRGLLFLAVGIGTARGLGQDRLRVFENGIGAINLPYLRCQHGPYATRSMHPRTLWLAEGLASAVSGRPFRIDAPFMLGTKAESVRAVAGIQAQVIATTVSCDTGRADADAATSYRAPRNVTTDALAAMAWQLDRLHDALSQPDPWHGLISEFPQILDVAPLAPMEVVRLYRAYEQEWQAVAPEFGLPGHGRSAA